MSCHPSHTLIQQEQARERKVKKREEYQERALKQEKHDLTPNPRAIKRQHRWRLGHDPADQDDYHDPNVEYLNIEYGEQPDPDQRDKLHGGEESGIPCQRCGTMTRICGETSQWEIMNQEGVQIVNRESISEARQKELLEETILILCCPKCYSKHQWLADMLPSKALHGRR